MFLHKQNHIFQCKKDIQIDMENLLHICGHFIKNKTLNKNRTEHSNFSLCLLKLDYHVYYCLDITYIKVIYI